MLLPFALIELIPARRMGLLTVIVAATAWISLSPYFATWTNPAHWPWYAALGIINSLFWVAVAIVVWRLPQDSRDLKSLAEKKPFSEIGFLIPGLAAISVLLFVEMTAAALVQPLVNSAASPIRAPLVPAGLEANALSAIAILAVIMVVALCAVWIITRRYAPFSRFSKFAILLPLVYLALYFLTFTLTKESTAAFELLLRTLGL